MRFMVDMTLSTSCRPVGIITWSIVLLMMEVRQCANGYLTGSTYYYTPSSTTNIALWRTVQNKFEYHLQQQRTLFPLFAAPRQRPASGSGGKNKKGPSGRNTSSSPSSSRTASTSSSSSRNASSKKTKTDKPSTQTPRTNTMRHQSTNDMNTGGFSPTTTAVVKSKPNAASSSKSTPPWNVRSAKDAIQNVEIEKIRRATIKNQQEQPATSTDTATITNMASTASQPLLSKTFLTNKEQQFIKWKRFKTSDRVVGQRLLHTFFNQTSLQQQILPNYGVPEIAFIGRSNVGKSSLLNTLSSSTTSSSSSSSAATTMARVGKTPGATASVNMYSLYDTKQKDLIVFTDLPGFGYAKLSKDRQEAIIRTTEQYIYQRSTVTKTLALGILLLDIRRTPSQDDIELLETLYDMNVPILVVVTKCDKVSSKYEREQLLNDIQNELQLPQSPFTISSMTGENINLLWQIIFDACDTCIQQMKQIYETIDTTEDDVDYDEEDDTTNEQSDSWYDEQDKPGRSSIDLLDDDDDIEYDQGFDWADDSIMLDYDDGYSSNDDTNNRLIDDTDDDNNEQDDAFGTSSDEMEPPTPIKRLTLKSLKRRVKKMQRRGEI